jgi:hypothetical protein
MCAKWVVVVIERCVFLLVEKFGMQTKRVPVGRVPQNKKHVRDAKYLLLKNT